MTSPHEFLAKVSCWQQRADPEAEANLHKRRKQRPVSIAGDSDTLILKRTEDGVMPPPVLCYRQCSPIL